MLQLEDDGGSGDPTTLAGAVYLCLRRDIVGGVLEPGRHLRLDDLRGRYGVGLSPIREALSRLASDRFVIGFENRGYRVAELSQADLRDLTAARVLIECDALRQSLAAGDEAWEAAVVAAHYRLAKADRRLHEADDALLDEWEVANRAFHDALVAACQSRWLQRFRRLLEDQARRYRRFSVKASAEVRAVAAEHAALAEACLARDVPRALTLIEAHIRTTADTIVHEIPAGGPA